MGGKSCPGGQSLGKDLLDAFHAVIQARRDLLAWEQRHTDVIAGLQLASLFAGGDVNDGDVAGGDIGSGEFGAPPTYFNRYGQLLLRATKQPIGLVRFGV